MNDDLARVIAHTAAKPAGNGWLGTCPCPGHETPEETLSIGVGNNGKLMLNCMSKRVTNHTFDDVLGELCRAGALDSPTPAAPPRPARTLADLAPRYGLTADAFTAAGCAVENGAVRYPTARPDGKTGAKFKTLARNAGGKRDCRHATGGAGFFPASSLTGPGVLVVTGGEEKALAGLAAGLRTVTYTAGEGSLKPEAAAFLVAQGNREFIVAMDADTAGRNGAERVAEALRTAGAASVRVCAWPEDAPKGRDLNDILRDDGPDALKRFLDAAQEAGKPAEDAPPRFAPVSTATLCAKPLQPVEWAVEAFAPVGLAMVFAPPRVGKSTFAVQLAAAVAAGRPFLGYATTKAQALYIDAENGPRRVQGLLDRLGYPQGLDNLDLFNPPADWQLNESGLADLEHYVEAHPALKVVVLDTLQRLIPSARIKGDAYEMSVERLKRLQAWTLKHRLLVLLVHHSKKPARDAAGESFDAASGSTGLTGTCEHTFGLKRHKGDLFKLEVVSRDMAQLELAVRLDKAGWELMGDFDEHTMTEQQRALVDFIRDNEGANIKTVHRALSFPSYDAAKQACYRATREGYLIQTKRGCFRTNTAFRSVPLDPEKEQKEGIEPCFRPPARAREAQDWMSAHEQRQDAFHLRGNPEEDPEEAAMSAAERGGRNLQ